VPNFWYGDVQEADDVDRNNCPCGAVNPVMAGVHRGNGRMFYLGGPKKNYDNSYGRSARASARASAKFVYVSCRI